MSWMQALLWLVMGIIVGAILVFRLINLGSKHARIVAIGACSDPECSRIHIKWIMTTDKHEERHHESVVLAIEDRPSTGFVILEQSTSVATTPVLRAALRECLERGSEESEDDNVEDSESDVRPRPLILESAKEGPAPAGATCGSFNRQAFAEVIAERADAPGRPIAEASLPRCEKPATVRMTMKYQGVEDLRVEDFCEECRPRRLA